MIQLIVNGQPQLVPSPGSGTDPKTTNDATLNIRQLLEHMGLQGKRIAVLAFGSMVTPAVAAGQALNATVVNMRFVKPIDGALLEELAATHDAFVTVEEHVVMGGAGSACAEALAQAGGTDLAVDENRHAGAEASILAEPPADPRKAGFQFGDDFLNRLAGDRQFGLAASQLLEQRRYKHGCHGLGSLRLRLFFP